MCKTRIPRRIISRYIRRIAQYTCGDFEKRLNLGDYEIVLIRFTPGFIQIVLIFSIYDRRIREKELLSIRALERTCSTLYEILSEKAGLLAEIRYYLGHGLEKFYVWLRDYRYIKTLLEILKDVYRMYSTEHRRS